MSELTHSYLQEQYVEKGRSTHDIAGELGTYPNRVRRVLVKLGFKIRNRSEAQKNSLRQGRHPHPTRGKGHSRETRQAISESRKDAWARGWKKRLYQALTGKRRWSPPSKKDQLNEERRVRRESRILRALSGHLTRQLFNALTTRGETVEVWPAPADPEAVACWDSTGCLSLPERRFVIFFDGPYHRKPIWGGEVFEKTLRQADLDNEGCVRSGHRVVRLLWDGKNLGQRRMKKLAEALLTALDDFSAEYEKNVLWADVKELTKHGA